MDENTENGKGAMVVTGEDEGPLSQWFIKGYKDDEWFRIASRQFPHLWLTTCNEGPVQLTLWDDKSEKSLFRLVKTGDTVRFESKEHPGDFLNC